MQVVGDALAWTLLVSSIALVLSFILGSLLGMYCAWKRKTLIDPTVTVYDAILGAVPSFVVAYLLVLLFSVKLGLLPAAWQLRRVDPSRMDARIHRERASARHIAGFIVDAHHHRRLGAGYEGDFGVSVLGEDFITSARARGLPDKRIVWVYVGRNALLPQITHLAMSFGMMFAGSVLIENIFVYPGMGFFFGRAITARDYPLMQGMFMIITVAVVIANLLAEILYSVIDPRIREAS